MVANTDSPMIFTPLNVSAASSSALRAMLSSLKGYLERHPETNMHHLCYTLQSRRSTLPYRQVIFCRSRNEAIRRIEAILAEDAVPESPAITRQLDVSTPRILGVFTGQGAQWVQMAASIIRNSPYASKRIDELETALQCLPEGDRPDWSLRSELLADTQSSRLSQAEVAQPLCTAVQIILVDLMRAAKVNLSGVVGHSSGEIGAAYAAGFLSAASAIYVAYYRGLYARLASSEDRKPGAMLAVGTSLTDAMDFCELDDYSGRVQLAAHNSPASVTLSGDQDAIEEAAAIFADEKKFVRKLRVDVAYHSHHMLLCAAKYKEALMRCNITPQQGNGVGWFSSVLDGVKMEEKHIQSQYWVDNMTNTVMFSNAVEAAVLGAGSYDLAIEFGPHPALKGPFLGIQQSAGWKEIPYTGLLSRHKDDVGELASALGFLWKQLGVAAVDFPAFEKQISGRQLPGNSQRIIRGIPSYPFDHGHRFYSLTRYSGSSVNAHAAPHPLLGRRSVESETENEVSWRQLLRPNEIKWLQGHQLQGQTVFPAMGFVAMAVEATAVLAGPARSIGLLDLKNVVIGRALTFDDDDVGMECRIVMSIRRFAEDQLSAQFSCYSGRPYEGAMPLVLNFCAQITASFHAPVLDSLPASRIHSHNLIPADASRFYSQFTALGYNYSKPFTGVREIQRKMNFACGIVEDESGDDWEDRLLLHPGLLDSVIQTGFAAYGYPFDNSLWTLQVPVTIQSISINLFFLSDIQKTSSNRSFQYQSATSSTSEVAMVVDIDLFATDENHPFVKFESVGVQPFAAATARDDACVFSRIEYGPITPDVDANVSLGDVSGDADSNMLLVWERISFFYMRHIYEEFEMSHKLNILPHYQRLLDNAGRFVDLVSRGEHATVPREALQDSKAFIYSLIAKHHQCAMVKLLQVVGENVETEIRRGGSMLTHMTDSGLLQQFFEELRTYPGAKKGNSYMNRFISQLSFRFPRMNILEIGAGDGAATSDIISALDGAYETYTYTDSADESLKRASQRFERYSDRMDFVRYDMERRPKDQGFEEGGYDVVIARSMLHTVTDLRSVISNCRCLLKPGGYLVLGDFIRNDLISTEAVFGSLSGWCIRESNDFDKGNGHCLTVREFDTLAKDNDLAGSHTKSLVFDDSPEYFCAWTWQAVDDRIQSLRTPLAALETSSTTSQQHLFVVGGQKKNAQILAANVCSLLRGRYENVIQVLSLEELNEVGLPIGSSVLCLSELDGQLLETRNEAKLESLKNLWRNGRTIVYVTDAADNMNPYSGMLLGLSRVIRYEHPNINLQILNFDVDTRPTAQILSESLIRLELGFQLLHDDEKGDALWSLEPELYYTNGHPLIPRLVPFVSANERYNAYRRAVKKHVNPRNETIGIEPVPNESIFELFVPTPLRVSPGPRALYSEKMCSVQLKYSTFHSVRVGESGFFNLATGTDMNSGDPVFFWFDTPAESRMLVPDDQILPVPVDFTYTRLLAIAAQLVASSILEGAPPFGSIMIHGAEVIMQRAIYREATLRGRQVLFTVGEEAEIDTLVQSTVVHQRLSLRVVRSLVPSHVSCFINAMPGCSSAALLIQCLSQNIPTKIAEEFFRVGSHAKQIVASLQITSAIQEACSRVDPCFINGIGIETDKVLSLNVISTSLRSETKARLSVVDWECSQVPAVIRPIDHGTIFRDDRTYILFGLAGDLGQSLCTWMVAHGARHIVLGSRQPKVASQFIESHRFHGATISVRTVDVTDRKSVYACLESIQAEMPSVGGVANGALVLEDLLFDDLDFASLERTAKPKVDGSLILDELFYDTPLEFFILFTSAVAVSGNTGQSAYIMANSFMTSLAADRRDRRGVAGSSIALGAVAGLGRFERSGHLDRDHFNKMGYRDSSEQDCHRLFAEAVWSGRPENAAEGSSQVCSGLSHVHKTPQLQAQLRDDPRFSHFMLPGSLQGRQGGLGGRGRAARPRMRLATVVSREEAHSVVRDAFIGRLKRILMISAEEQLNTNLTFVEQGLDSIMAVEVRTWFLSEVEVDIPVLQILGAGATVDTLVDGVIEKIPTNILNWGKLQDHDGDLEATGQTAANLSTNELLVMTDNGKSNGVVGVLREAPPQVSWSSSSSGDSLESHPSSASSPPMSESRAGTPTGVQSNLSAKESLVKVSGGSSVLNPGSTETAAVQNPAGEYQNTGLCAAERNQILGSSSEVTAEMTFGQKGIWLLSHYIDDPTTFNMSIMLKLTGLLNVRSLTKAVQSVAERHEALRTRFFWSEDAEGVKYPMQGVLSKPLMRLETVKIASPADAMGQLDAMQSYQWDLNDWLAVRLCLLSLSDTEHYLLVGANHIVLDGHSYTIMMLDIEKAYINHDHQVPKLPETSQIRAFGAQEHMLNTACRYRHSVEYYHDMLNPKDLLVPIDLLSFARTRVRLPLTCYNTHVTSQVLNHHVASQLNQLARRRGATSFHAYLAALQTLLFRLLPTHTTEDIFIGMADANRHESKFLGSVGNFLNLLPLKFRRRDCQSFGQAIEAASAEVHRAMKHIVPFDLLLQELNVPRSNAWSPIFQIFIDYRLVPSQAGGRAWSGCRVTDETWRAAKSAYDIVLEVAEDKNETLLKIHMQASLYKAEGAELLLRSFVNLLENVVRAGDGTDMKQLPRWSNLDMAKAIQIGHGQYLFSSFQ